jgi:hypothetical protein
MKHLPEVIDEERDRLQAEKLERVTRETEAYWNETAPCGALPVKPFTLADGVELLLLRSAPVSGGGGRDFRKGTRTKGAARSQGGNGAGVRS